MLRKKIFIPLYILIFFYVLFGFLLFIFQNSFFYPADKTSFGNCPKLEKSEKITQGDFRAYFIKRSSEKVVVYYHGNGGRACDRYYMETYFEPLGYSVLFVEYPGYAENGDTSMDKILNGVTLVNTFLKKQSFKEIIVVGESVGTGPAAYQASLLENNIDKLILITPYNNMASVAAFHYPWYPMKLLVRNNFTPDKWLKNVTIPVTLILAESDEVVGFKQGEILSNSLLPENKNVYVVKGAGHNSIYGMQEFSAIFLNLLIK
jgi:fermentation-respiration switch protein FrsA (DUF1100 family)